MAVRAQLSAKTQFVFSGDVHDGAATCYKNEQQLARCTTGTCTYQFVLTFANLLGWFYCPPKASLRSTISKKLCCSLGCPHVCSSFGFVRVWAMFFGHSNSTGAASFAFWTFDPSGLVSQSGLARLATKARINFATALRAAFQSIPVASILIRSRARSTASSSWRDNF